MVERVEGRERAARFAELADRRLTHAYRLATLVLGSPADAEDATHDALIRAWHAWPRLRNRDRFDAWFDRIVVNVCRDRLRRQGRVATWTDPDPAGPDDHVGDLERRDEIEGALETLNPDQRVAVVLRYWADLPMEEIAARTGAPAGTIRSRIHHSLNRMREALGRPEMDR